MKQILFAVVCTILLNNTCKAQFKREYDFTYLINVNSKEVITKYLIEDPGALAYIKVVSLKIDTIKATNSTLETAVFREYVKPGTKILNFQELLNKFKIGKNLSILPIKLDGYDTKFLKDSIYAMSSAVTSIKIDKTGKFLNITTLTGQGNLDRYKGVKMIQ